MKIERLRSSAPLSRCPLSIEEPIEDDGVPSSSTRTGQPIVHPSAKASTSTTITNSAIAKRKDNPYTKPGVGKCYRCDEPGHRSMSARRRGMSI